MSLKVRGLPWGRIQNVSMTQRTQEYFPNWATRESYSRGRGKEGHKRTEGQIHTVEQKPKEVSEALFKPIYMEAIFLQSITRLTLIQP